MGAIVAGGLTGLLNQSSAQMVDGSVKFDGAYLNKTWGSAPTSSTTQTFSYWVKLNEISPSANRFPGIFGGNGSTGGESGFSYRSGTARIKLELGGGSKYIDTTQVFRDIGWYHIAGVYDTTQATDTDRLKLYVNGERVTDISASSYPTSSQASGLLSNTKVDQIGAYTSGANTGYFNLTQFYGIDGLALGPGYFGFTDPLTGTWRPKKFKAEGTTVNDGTQWSSLVDVSNATVNNGSAANLFDGDTTTKINITGGYIEIDLSSRNVQAGPEGIEVYNNEGGAYTSYQVNGGTAINWQASAGWMSMGGVNSKINTIRINHLSGGGVNAAFAFRVNGVTMVDSTTTNLAFGTNGFYLPMDGNSPIGEDKSGKGNNWTPVSFGGSVSLDNPIVSGARPILNTDGGGNVARPGVRTDDLSSNLKLAVDHAGTATDRTNAINGNTNLMTSFSANNSTYAYPTDASGSPYGKALYISGTGDYPRINYTAGDFNFMHNQDDSGTVEFWFYNGAYSTEGYLFANVGESSQVGLTLPMGSATTFNCYIQRGVGGGSQNAGTSTLPRNKWSHIAVTKQKVGSNVELKVYVNGVNTASNTSITATDLSNSNSAQTYWQTGSPIGHESSRGFTNAYISDIRIYNTVKYTSDFVVASTSPDILPDTPSGVSGGSKLAKVTDGAVSFDGTGDYLSTSSSSSDFTMGTGDFTVECFLTKSAQEHKGVFQISDTSGGLKTSGLGGTIALGYQSGVWQIYGGGGETTAESSSYPIGVNKWYHLAYVRSSGVSKLYVDGVQVISLSDTTNYNTTYMAIGGYYNTSYLHRGFISNLRVIKGTALYTANFTPPFRTLTNVTNTKLLCCQSNTLAGSAAVSPNLGGVNDGTVWSRFLSSPDDPDGSESYKLFDGNISNLYSPGANTITFDITSIGGIAVSTSLEVYFSSSVSARDYSVNGGSAVNSGTGTKWVDLGFTGTFNTLTGTNGGQIGAIRIDGSTILLDPVSPVGNVAATNFNPFNTDINTVRGQETGYATLNPLSLPYSASGDTRISTVSNGNLTYDGVTSYWGPAFSTIPLGTTGKYYFETIPAGGSNVIIGVGKYLSVPGNRFWDQGTGTQTFYYNAGGNIGSNGSTLDSNPGSISASDVIGFAMDCDGNIGKFYKNGVLQATVSMPAAVITAKDAGTVFPFCDTYNGTYVVWNFGQKPFKFPPPDGFQPINAANVRPETVITRPDHYVDVDTYTGTTPNPLERSNFSFAPDFLWFKSRAGSRDHVLFDTVRGRAQGLKSNGTDAQAASGATQDLVSFDNNGFTVGEIFRWSSTNRDESLVVWAWKAGGSKNTFNVDDVGYANASDVNMSVGSLSNKTQLWSGLFTLASGSFDQAITNAFNGSISESTRARTSGNAVLITMTLSTPVTVSSEIKVFGETGYDSTCTVTVGGITYTSSSGSVHTFNVSGSLTRMTLVANGGSGRTYFEGMEIDSKILVDSNVSVNVPSIAPTGVSVGTKQGFSIIKYTGNGNAATIPHGLSQTPTFLIKKFVTASSNWDIWTPNIGANNRLIFTDAATSSTTSYQNVNASTFDVHAGNNDDTVTMIAYLWHDVPGLQKFGSFEGNGNADGPFIELGFRPSIILTKNMDNYGTNYDWCIYDNTRSTLNPNNKFLCPNLTYQENYRGDNTADNARDVDFLSNGFKIRNNSSPMNLNAHTIIYAAWAEAPAFNLYGGQSNAR